MSGIGVLDDFHVTIRIPVAWGDMDAFSHVNNTVYFRWFESARIAYFDVIGFTRPVAPDTIGPILASTHCRFRLPLSYPDTITVGARVSALGADRFTMQYRALSDRHHAIAADGEGVVVSYDYAAGAKTALPEAVRARIRALDDI